VGAASIQRTAGASALGYCARILPRAAHELSRWDARARAIPDATLRRHALAALRKRANMHGAALFALLAPAGARAPAVRALVAIQSAYNYLDMLAEQPSADPLANAAALHAALLAALDPAAPHPDYYAHQPRREDGEYLLALLALAADPSLEPSEPAAVEAAYFPWVGALHTMLDSLVDVAEDRREGQRNLLGHYDSPAGAAARVGALAREAGARVRALARGRLHELILTAMACHYLSAPQAAEPRARAIAAAATDATGPLVRRSLPAFKLALALSGPLRAGA